MGTGQSGTLETGLLDVLTEIQKMVYDYLKTCRSRSSLRGNSDELEMSQSKH